MKNGLDKKLINGNVNINYKISNHFDVMMRSGIEVNNEERTTKRPFNSANYSKGYYREQYIKATDLNNDLLVTYKNNYKDFDIRTSVGGNIRYSEYTMNDYWANGLQLLGVYTMPNAISAQFSYAKPSDKQLNSVYGLVSFAYQNKYFLDFTARNDWSSALPKAYRSYFYPSVSTSLILSDIFNIQSDALSLWKVRASWSKVGNDTDPYKLVKYYKNSDFTGSVEVPSTYANPDLKPEMLTTLEAGMDISFLKNRINLGTTVYQNNNKNQIIDIPSLLEAGYSYRTINSGEIRNRGLELMLNTTPIKSKNFTWNLNANWSINKNTILSLPAEFQGEPYTMASVGGVVYYNAVVGGSLGDMYGYGLQYSPDGQVVYGSDGLTAKPTQLKKLGNAYAKWRAGLQNEFKYKNFSISLSFDGQYGGIAYSQSHHKMSEQGKLTNTLWGRDNAGGLVIGQGVVQNNDGSYSANTKAITVATYYADYYRRANIETNSFDTSFIKLREARISYTFPKQLTDHLKMTELTMALFGRNLWMWTKYPMFDPEAATLDDSTITPGIEMGQLPSARTVGIQLNVKF